LTGKYIPHILQTIKSNVLSIIINLLRIVDNEKYPAFFELNGCKYKLKVEKYE